MIGKFFVNIVAELLSQLSMIVCSKSYQVVVMCCTDCEVLSDSESSTQHFGVVLYAKCKKENKTTFDVAAISEANGDDEIFFWHVHITVVVCDFWL